MNEYIIGGIIIIVITGITLFVLSLIRLWEQVFTTIITSKEGDSRFSPKAHESAECYGIWKSEQHSEQTLQHESMYQHDTTRFKKRQQYFKKRRRHRTWLLAKHYLGWTLHALTPHKREGYPSVFENIKTILVNPQFQSLRLAFAGWFVVALVLIGVQVQYKTPAQAATLTWDGGAASDNWSDCNNWSTDACPGVSDIAQFDGGVSNSNSVIDAGFGGTIGGILICDGTSCGSAAYTGTITQNRSLTVGQSDYTQHAGTFVGSSVGGGTQDMVMNGGKLLINGGSFTAPSGTLRTTEHGDQSIVVDASATFDHGMGTIEMNYTSSFADQTIDAPTTLTLYNLVLNQTHSQAYGVKAASGDTITVEGTMTLQAGETQTGGTFLVTGDLVHNSAFRGGDGAVTVTGTDARTITVYGNNSGGQGEMPYLTLDAPNVTLSTTGTAAVLFERLDLDQGTINIGTNNVSIFVRYVQDGGTYNGGTGSTAFSSAPITINAGAFTASAGACSWSNDFTITAGSVDFSPCTSVSAGGYVQSGGTVTSTPGTWTSPDFDSNMWNHSAGTWNHASGTLQFTHTSNGTPTLNTPNGVTTTFYSIQRHKDIAFGSSYGYFRVTSGDIIDVAGTLSTSGYGRIDGSQIIYVSGDVDILGSNASTNPLTLVGSNSQVIDSNSYIDGDIVIDKTGGEVSLNQALTMNASGQDLTITNGTVDLSGNNLSVSGAFNVQNASTLRLVGSESSVSTPTLSASSTVEYDGVGTYTLKDWTYPSLTLGLGTYSPAGAVFTVNDTLTNNGTLRFVGNETVSIGSTPGTAGTVEYIGNGDAQADVFVAHNLPYNNLTVNMTDAADTLAASGTPPNNTLDDQLDGYWKFDEATATNATDSSPSGNTLTLGGGAGPQPDASTPSVSFVNPKSRDFDGSDDHFEITGGISQLSGGDFSISYWAYREASRHEAFAFTDNGSFNASSPFAWDNNELNIGNGTSFQTIGITLAADLNTWTHIVFVADLVNNKLYQYKNGTVVDNGLTMNFDPSPIDTVRFRIGRGAFSDSYNEEFNGKIDDFRLYDRALTAQEISDLAAGYDQSGGGSPPPVASIDVNGNFALSSGIFTAPTNTLSVAGNWTKTAGTVFNHNSASVVFDGASQVVSGTSTFYNFTKNVTSAATLTFPDGVTTTFSNSADIKGVSGQALSLRSSGASAALLDFAGTRTMEYLDVKDMNNVAVAAAQCVTGCVDSTGNTNWTFTLNDAPTLASFSVSTSTDGSGNISISAIADDADDDTLQVKIEQKLGDCTSYTGQSTTTMSSTVTATHSQGSITVDNSAGNGFQVQNISTASGANTLGMTWNSATDLAAANGTYCIFVTPNDGTEDGTTVSSTIVLDNLDPTNPGALSVFTTTTQSVQLTFGSTVTETNFAEYKVFYKQGASGVTESDTAHTSSTDANLASRTFNSATSTLISGLTTSTQYVMNIIAYDTYGNSSTAAAETSFYTLAGPVTGVSATNTTSNTTLQLQTSWTNAVPLQTGMKIDRDDSCNGSYDQVIYDSAAANATSPLMNNTNLSAGTCYIYRLATYNQEGALNLIDAVTTTITAPPGQPQNLRASNIEETQITWEWDAVSGATSYQIIDNGSQTPLATVSAPTVQYIQTGLTSNQQYCVIVRAETAGNGKGIASSVICATTDPLAPQNVSHSTQTLSSITWTWNNSGQTNFYARDKNNTGNNSGTITSTSWVMTGLAVNTQYTLEVKGRNSESTESAYSEATAYTAQNDPTGIAFANVTPTSIQITGNGSFPGNGTGSAAVRFTNTTASTTQDNTADTSNPVWNNSGLSPNIFYTYRVEALNGDGDLSNAVTSSVYTLANTPGTPTIQTVSTTILGVTINVNSNSASTTYAILEAGSSQFVGADGLLTNAAVYQTTSSWYGTSTYATVAGLTANTGYTFKVIAKNSNEILTSYSATSTRVFTNVGTNERLVQSNAQTDTIVSGGETTIVVDGTEGASTNLSQVTINGEMADTEEVHIDFRRVASSGQVNIGNQLQIDRGSINVDIPANTTINGGNSWTGSMLAPTVRQTTTVQPARNTDTVRQVVEIGFGTQPLTFDRLVKIVVPGATGQLPAYAYGGGAAVEITFPCNSATDCTNVLGRADEIGYFDDGQDIIIWTKHFTSFFVYDRPAAANGAGSPGVAPYTAAPAPSMVATTGGGGGFAAVPVVLNSGASETSKRDITVTLNVLGASMVAISNRPDFRGSSYAPFQRNYDWTLEPGNGPKRVYVRFRTAEGGTGDAVAEITLIGQTEEPNTIAIPQATQEETGEVNAPTRPAETVHGEIRVNTETGELVIESTEQQQEKTKEKASVIERIKRRVFTSKKERNRILLLEAYVGKPVRAQGTRGVYILTKEGTKRAFLNADIYFSYFGSWNDVHVVDKDALESIPNDERRFMPYGPNYQPKDGTVVKSIGDPRVYVLSQGSKHWIPSPRAFRTNGFAWEEIKDVSSAFLNAYEEGEQIQ